MIRPLALIPLLVLGICACGHASTSHQHTAAPTQQTPAAAQQPSPATNQAPAVTPEDETAQATAAQESAGDKDDEDRPPDRSDVSLVHLAALPADAQLPSGKWKPGVNYDP